MADELVHFIGGKRTAGRSGRFGEVFNPATGKSQKRVPFAGAAEVGVAVKAAADAFGSWAMTSPLNRARVLVKFKTIVERDADTLAA